MRPQRVLPAALLCLVLLTAPTLAAPASIDAAGAIAAAQTAAVALGIPFGPDAVATEFIAPGQRPAWWVRCGYRTRFNQAYNSFWLARATGAVLLAENLDASRSGGAGPLLPEAQAITRATAALEAVGLPQDISLKGAEFTCERSRADSTCESDCTCDGCRRWRVTWHRMYEGFPYEDDADVVVELNARTGEVISLRVFPAPPPPGRTVVAVSGARAMAITLAHVAALLGRPVPQSVTTARLEIAQPYLTWSDPNAPDPSYDDPTCLVWRVEVSTRANEEWLAYGIDPTQFVAYALVEAATGVVVGDTKTSCRLHFLASPPPGQAGRAALRSLLLAAAVVLALLVAGGLLARFLLLSRA